jgi:hypothetical protein
MRKRQLISAILVIAIGAAESAAPSYVGCFNAHSWPATAIQHRSYWTLNECAGVCQQLRQPLVGLAPQRGACYCGSHVLNGAWQLRDSHCQSQYGNATATYYLNHGVLREPLRSCANAALT